MCDERILPVITYYIYLHRVHKGTIHTTTCYCIFEHNHGLRLLWGQGIDMYAAIGDINQYGTTYKCNNFNLIKFNIYFGVQPRVTRRLYVLAKPLLHMPFEYLH